MLLALVSACARDVASVSHAAVSRPPPSGAGVGEPVLVAFNASPFPYHGDIPDKGVPFLNVSEDGKLGHQAPRGGTLWEDSTYNDNRTLLYIPQAFDPRRAGVMVVFFHGNNATLERDVRDRQGVPRQIDSSGLNAVLVAPQFAYDARDSSAGRFWQPGAFHQYLDEAAEHLAEQYGDEGLRRRFASMPVILVAYSGGYLPAAFALDVGGAGGRIVGVILLDALYGEADRFVNWIAERGAGFFFSAYSPSTRDENLALQRSLSERGIAFEAGASSRIARGSVTFVDAGDNVEHNDFVTRAWADDPLAHVLAMLDGYRR